MEKKVCRFNMLCVQDFIKQIWKRIATKKNKNKKAQTQGVQVYISTRITLCVQPNHCIYITKNNIIQKAASVYWQGVCVLLLLELKTIQVNVYFKLILWPTTYYIYLYALNVNLAFVILYQLLGVYN